MDAALQWVPQPPQPSRANAKPQQRYILSAHVVLPTMETNKVVVVTATPLYAERPTWTGRRGISYVAAGRTMARMNCLRRSGRRKIYRSTASLWRNADAHSDRFCLLWLFVLEFFSSFCSHKTCYVTGLQGAGLCVVHGITPNLGKHASCSDGSPMDG